MKRIACVIPAYNEAATIADVIGRACRHMPWVIVVDDGSLDGTADRLGGLPVTVLRNPSNQGKATSLLRGARFAIERGADTVITLDGDGQHRPEEIPRLVAMAERYPRHIIIAARVRGRAHAPRLRRCANRFADFWISWAAGYPIGDTQSGFRLYPAGVFAHIKPHYNRQQCFVFESEALIDAARGGYYSQCVEVDSLYRPGARDSYYRPVIDTLLIVRMVAWKLIRHGLHPMGLLRSIGWVQPSR